MKDIINCININFRDFVIQQCKDDHKCKLVLNEIANYIILKPDKYRTDIQMCDCLLFSLKNDELYVILCEIKGKNPNSSEIHNQLKGGVELLKVVAKKCGINFDIKLYFIAIAKSWKKIEYKMLENININYKGYKYGIIAKKCGTQLKDVIKEYYY